MPLRFEPLAGDRGEGFVARASKYAVLVGPGSIDVAFAEASHLRLTLAGGTATSVTGRDQLPGRSNYLTGDDPSRWRRDVPAYGRVEVSGVYPGIDTVFYGNGTTIEEDFDVAPGADPSAIALDIDGAEATSIDADGALSIATPAGRLRLHRPVIYQRDARGRREIAGAYVMRGQRRVGFAIGAYDTTRPLVIDPVLTYATYLGGSADDHHGLGLQAVAVDAAGNLYFSGATASADFPGVGSGSLQTTNGGGYDAFVAKMNAAGTALIYCTYLGGNSLDMGAATAVDTSGNVYVAGLTNSTNFPIAGAAPLQTTFGGTQDGFVAKLNATGSNLLYSTYLGGSLGDYATGLALDSSGNAYVTGFAVSANFPGTSTSAIQPARSGFNDDFVVKVASTGALVYATYLGGTDSESPGSIAVDASGSAYVTGASFSSDFPGTSTSAIQSTFGGGSADAFVVKINPAGSALVYSTYLGGSAYDSGLGIAVDASGSAFVVGDTQSASFPGVSAASFQPANNGGHDGFLAKLTPTGSALSLSTFLGGSGDDDVVAVALDAGGNIHLACFTLSSDFPGTAASPIQSAYGGGGDMAILQMSPTATSILFGTYIGGSNLDDPSGIALDAAGSDYVVGWTYSTDVLSVGSTALQPANAGGIDLFIVKIGSGSIAAVVATVDSLGLAPATATSLTAKLQASATPGGTTPSCNKLTAFGNEVQAQTGKSITSSQASQLLAAASSARAALACK